MRLFLLAMFFALPAAAQEPAWRAFAAPPIAAAPEGLRMGWSLHYRGAMPHSAFAFAMAANGRAVWNFSGAQATPEAAQEAALSACARSAEPLGATCRIFAVNGRAEGRAPVIPADSRIGPLRASPLHTPHGPQGARGVVVWSHGRASATGGARPDLRNSPAQGWLSLFNDAGWDVLRFDREPHDDEVERSTAQLLAALPQLRQAGYSRIVLAGQSRGAWHSMLAASRAPEAIHAVIAVAPAMHGSDSRAQGAALDDWRRLVNGLPPAGPRLAAVLFRDDAYDPLPSARVERWEGMARRAPSLVISPASGPGQHGAGATIEFTRAWGTCLLRFVEAPAPPSGTLRANCE